MILNLNSIRILLAFILLLFFSGCSSFDYSSLVFDNHNTNVAHDLDQPTDEEIKYLDIEPEEKVEKELKEELAALEKTGSWEEQALQDEEIDPPETVFDFPITHNKQVQFYLDQFQGRQRKTFGRWLARSTKYSSFIEPELEKAGLPKDLLFLAMIESGFNPSAYSKAHAAGLWQFIRGTGKNYGLRINSWVDERRNPEKATKAAIKYLSFLHDEFDDWYLAVAAYNAGEGKIGRGIKKYKTDNFWKLADRKYLSLETKRYVPKLIAAILIGREPEKYGFNEIAYKKPQEYDLIKVPARTDLEAVAVTANTSIKKLRTLNNELRKNQTPPGTKEYYLKIPAGTHDMVLANLDRLHPVVTTAFKTHTVRKGETISAVCRKYKINKTILLKANNLRTASLKSGQRLRIPYRTTKYILLKEGETPQSRFANAGKDGKMILHQLERGETLSKISKQYDVPVAVIMQWNNIKNVRRIKAGDHLALYLGTPPPSAASFATGSLSKANTDLIILSDVKKWSPVATKQSNSPIWYSVKNGDSLWTIARKFNVSASQLRQWNSLSSNLIKPGTKLVIKKV